MVLPTLKIFKLVLLAFNLAHQTICVDRIDWESIIVVIDEKVDIPLSLLYSITGQERSRTRMLDLLCAILIFKHGHAVISW
jgi:hypothetical protein